MVTLSPESGVHPRREAALAAHKLRAALAAAGLLDNVPRCGGEVVGGRPVVQLGDIDATAARALADLIERGARAKRRRTPAPGERPGSEAQ